LIVNKRRLWESIRNGVNHWAEKHAYFGDKSSSCDPPTQSHIQQARHRCLGGTLNQEQLPVRHLSGCQIIGKNEACAMLNHTEGDGMLQELMIINFGGSSSVDDWELSFAMEKCSAPL
jgi:hypothetical protein